MTDRSVSVLAFPMHGQQKLLSEGYRTRDGHFIEWFGRLKQSEGPVAVVSRPEPQVLRPLVRTGTSQSAANTEAFDSYSWRFPNLRDRRSWWLQSLNSYPNLPGTPTTPAIVWNPMVSLSNVGSEIFNSRRRVVVDLLDDWSIHYAFESIAASVEEAYRRSLGEATIVTANSEGTLALAKRFGRSDAVLMTNGCDPDRFITNSKAEGKTTVGYVGKIGRRVDLDLVIEAASSLPGFRFIFAGPILDREYLAPLKSMNNIELLGDVHYRDVPNLLTSFDIGWVPHRVGKFEIGGDIIKTYEYRAAHLPVLSTPLIGAGDRGLDHVCVLPSSEHTDWLRQCADYGDRVIRKTGVIPSEHTWEDKAIQLLGSLDAIR
ncbi:glycosyltransferase [Rhodococcus sp. 24CO]|uniref:glycosyltransferase n=1 Tax=Rhodococcus sp. 24CO TaxID=3117460 RepID=UPI003D3350D0